MPWTEFQLSLGAFAIQALDWPSLAQPLQTGIARDTDQPSGKLGTAFKTRQMLEGLEKCLLQCIPSFLLVAQNADQGSVDAFTVELHECFERVQVPGLRLSNQLSVGINNLPFGCKTGLRRGKIRILPPGPLEGSTGWRSRPAG